MLRLKAEGAEVVAGDEFAGDGAGALLGLVASSDDGDRCQTAWRLILQTLGRSSAAGARCRWRTRRSCRRRVFRRSRVDAALVGVAYTDEGGGVNDGEVLEQDGVDQGEDSSVGSYAEGEGQNGSHGEAAALSELPEGIADVLKKSSEEEARTLFVGLCSHALNSPERYDRFSACLLWRHSGRDVFLGLPFDVELQLVVYFTIGFWRHQKTKARQPFFEHRSSYFSTKAIAVEMRPQSSSSACSCFCPVLVSE